MFPVPYKMTKDEFKREFETLHAACLGKKPEADSFVGRAYWLKFKDMKAKAFLSLWMLAVDRLQDRSPKFRRLPSIPEMLALIPKPDLSDKPKPKPPETQRLFYNQKDGGAFRNKILAEMKANLEKGRGKRTS